MTAVGRARRLLHPGIRAQAAVVVAFEVLVLSGLVGTVGLALRQEDDISGMVAGYREAETANLDLMVAMVNQETGLRGYAGTGQQRFLDPYRLGQAAEGPALAELRRQARDPAVARDVEAVRKAALDWSDWALRRKLQVDEAGGASVDIVMDAEGKGFFDHFRTLDDELTSTITRSLSEADGANTASRERAWTAIRLAWLLSVAGLLLLALMLLFRTLRPIATLAAGANVQGRGDAWDVPYAGREDEVGDLARALQNWHRAESLRTVVFEHAPFGIANVGLDRVMMTANPELGRLHHRAPEALVGRSVADVTDADYRKPKERLYDDVAAGRRDRFTTDTLYRRDDGTVWWGQVTVAGVRNGSALDSFVAMVADITDRKEKSARAARIQQDLLPREAPPLNGFRLAAHCVPADEVGGDFYDWYLLGEGRLALTVGDVMGKGMGAALLMATVRATLRAVTQLSDPAEAVGLGSRAVAQDLEETQTFVTLVHARLDDRSGELRVVDAGHGLAFVLRATGVVERLPVRNVPLGSFRDTVYEEVRLQLAPGDSFLAVSDGVLDLHECLAENLEVLTPILAGATEPAEVIRRLTAGDRTGPAPDDVTVVVLHRLPA